MHQSFSTPVLLLLFNRPKHTEAVIDRLRELRPSLLFVHCDGPRTTAEAEKVVQVREQVKNIDWPCEIRTLFREENAGLRAGVSNALDWFFASVEQGIILEDDCLPDPSFFPFCAELLDRYATVDQVMHIGGSNVGEPVTGSLSVSYFFSQFSFVWGWASWRRAWAKMSLDMDGFEAFMQGNRIRSLSDDVMAQAYMLDKFRATRARENNSWAYAWAFSVLNHKGLSIVPRINLVQNTGIGEAGATHTREANPLAKLKASSMEFPLRHPDRIERPPGLDKRIFYLSQKSRIRLILWFLMQKFGLR